MNCIFNFLFQMRKCLPRWLQKNLVKALKIVRTNFEENLCYRREQLVQQRPTWRCINAAVFHIAKIIVLHAWSKELLWVNVRLKLLCSSRVLPRQRQKTLGIGQNVLECRENHKICLVMHFTLHSAHSWNVVLLATDGFSLTPLLLCPSHPGGAVSTGEASGRGGSENLLLSVGAGPVSSRLCVQTL